VEGDGQDHQADAGRETERGPPGPSLPGRRKPPGRIPRAEGDEEQKIGPAERRQAEAGTRQPGPAGLSRFSGPEQEPEGQIHEKHDQGNRQQVPVEKHQDPVPRCGQAGQRSQQRIPAGQFPGQQVDQDAIGRADDGLNATQQKKTLARGPEDGGHENRVARRLKRHALPQEAAAGQNGPGLPQIIFRVSEGEIKFGGGGILPQVNQAHQQGRPEHAPQEDGLAHRQFPAGRVGPARRGRRRTLGLAHAMDSSPQSGDTKFRRSRPQALRSGRASRGDAPRAGSARPVGGQPCSFPGFRNAPRSLL